MKLRKVLIIGGILLLIVILIPIVHHYQLRAATNSYIAELKARGEPMEISQVVPPAVPAEQNGADALRKSAVMFRTNGSFLSSNYFFDAMKMVAVGKAAVVSRQPDYRDYYQTKSWKKIREAVVQNAEGYAALYQIIQKPNFSAGINYEKEIDSIAFTNLLLSEAKVAAARLETAALSDLYQGHAAAAVENVRGMLAVAKGMREERLIISQMAAIAVQAMAAPTTWEILQSTNVTDQQLAALQKDWADLEFFHAMEKAFELERASGIVTANKFRDGDPVFDRSLLDPPESPFFVRPKLTDFDRLRIKSRIFCWRYWWSYPDEMRELKGEQLILDACRAAQTNNELLRIKQTLQTNIAKFPTSTNDDTYYWFSNAMNVDLHFALSESIRTSAHTFYRVITREVEKRMVIIAIALKRYQLKHGVYPTALDKLAPEFLSAVPLDLDGKQMRYQRNVDSSFTLYSIGDNGVDNGGDPMPTAEHKSSLQWEFGRDWVWPQPATAAEIRKYYDNLAK